MAASRITTAVCGCLTLIALAGCSLGCATRPGPLPVGPVEPVVELYSRNEVVCVPTLLGNAVGGAVGLVPFALVAPLLVSLPEDQVWVAPTLISILVSSGYLGGALFGTPFVPLSFLLPYDPC